MQTRGIDRQPRRWLQTLRVDLAFILARMTLAVVLAILAMFLFIRLAHEVAEGSTLRFDTAILAFFHVHRNPGLHRLMRGISWLAGPVPQSFILVLAIIGFTLAGQFWPDG